jgi:hypothetical protein
VVSHARRARPTLNPRRGANGAKTRLVWLAAIFFLASAYFYQDPEWNGNSRLDLTRAIVEDGTVKIDRFVNEPDWATEDRAFLNNHYYTDKAIGSSLLAVPVYYILAGASHVFRASLSSILIKHILTTAVVASAFTLCGLVMYLIAEKVAQDSLQALVSALATAFGTMLWPYSAVFYGHVPTAAFLILAFYLLYRIDDSGRDSASRLAFGAALAATLAFITEYPAGLIVAGMIPYALYKMRRLPWRRIVAAAAWGVLGAMPPLAAVLLYNNAAFGNAIATGYAFETENRFVAGMSQGFMGLHRPSVEAAFHITLDPQFGLFWQSPVLLLAAIGAISAFFVRRNRAEVIVTAYAAGAMLAMNAGYYLWWGGSAFGPRLLIPMLPFLVIPIALVPRSWLWLTIVLGIISAAQMLIPLLGEIQTARLTFRTEKGLFYVKGEPFQGFSLLYGYNLPELLRQYRTGSSPWNLGTSAGLSFWMSLPALLAVETALFLGLRRAEQR